MFAQGHNQREILKFGEWINERRTDKKKRKHQSSFWSPTLFKLPKPILCIADVFHSGRGGTNCTAGGCCFNTPRGRVHSTASHLYMKVWVVERVLTAITSQPGGTTEEWPFDNVLKTRSSVKRDPRGPVHVPEAVYRTCRTAVFNLMSKPSARATGTQE